MKTRAERKTAKKEKQEAEKAKLAAMTPAQRFRYHLFGWVRAIVLALVVLTPIRTMALDWNDIPSGSMEPTMLVGDRILVNKHDYGVRWPVPWKRYWIAQYDTPDLGDICIWHNPDNKDQNGNAKPLTMVKRCLGTPGDTVVIEDGLVVSVNGIAAEHEEIERHSKTVNRGRGPERLEFEILRETLTRADGTKQSHSIQRWTDHFEAQKAAFQNRRLVRGRFEYTLEDGEYLMIGDNRDLSNDSRFYGMVPIEHIYGSSGRVAISLDYSNYFLPRFSRFFRSVD
ncbi:MAG: signal peptidase I [Planctomycetota bacterium]